MRAFFKKIIISFLVFLIVVMPIMAKENIKFVSGIQQEFTPMSLPEEIVFKTTTPVLIKDEISIPENSVITVEVIEAQKERRWHKSGYILCKLKKYSHESMEEPVDVSEKDVYLIGRKYEMIDKKEAAILTTEIILTQAASIVGSCFIFFAPVDIAYFFAKGAIQREKDPNWFKAGFYNAYDNSIMWFWFKGRPIELVQDDTVQLKGIKEKKVKRLQKQIVKRKTKQAVKDQKKQVKLEKKQEKRQEKADKRQEKAEKRLEEKQKRADIKQEKAEKRLEEKQKRADIKQEKAEKRLKETQKKENSRKQYEETEFLLIEG